VNHAKVLIARLEWQRVKQRAVQHRIERCVVGQLRDVSLDELDRVEAALRGGLRRRGDGSLRKVDTNDVEPSGRELQRVVADAAADVEYGPPQLPAVDQRDDLGLGSPMFHGGGPAKISLR
jgi:hypothetical protein